SKNPEPDSKSPDPSSLPDNDPKLEPKKEPTRRSTRKTRWISGQTKKVLKMASLGLGLFFVPTHIIAEPGLPNLPGTSTNVHLHSDTTHMQPLDSTPNLEKLRAYHSFLDKWNQLLDPQPEDTRWAVQKILKISNKPLLNDKRSIFLKVQFQEGDKTWVSMDNMRLEDPHLLISHAITKDLLDAPGFEWMHDYLAQDEDNLKLIQAYRTAKKDNTEKKFHFGVEVPRNPKHALEIDKRNGNDGWAKSIKKELDEINQYKVFKVVPDGERIPPGYKRIPYHIVHDVKFDGRLKSRLVAGGHMSPEVHKEDKFSTVVSMEAVRLGFMIARINDLHVCAGDIGNAFLNAHTNEKLFIVAGPEFGPKLEGKRLIIDKSIYGLKSSGARFHELTSVVLADMGFKPTKADPNLLMRIHPDGHYKYCSRFVDNVIAFAKDPLSVMKELEKCFLMKGVGAPQYYLGGDVHTLDAQWQAQGLFHSFSADTYIGNCVPKMEAMMAPPDKPMYSFKTTKVPMDPEYHPELDESPLLDPVDTSKYKSMIGSLNWILTLGRFDIAFALNTMSRYNMAPRERHALAVQRIFGYLKYNRNGQIILDPGDPEGRN
ncbi:MAG: reverse transcriptase domain-containing protein, partial [Bacteroidota bacterium]